MRSNIDGNPIRWFIEVLHLHVHGKLYQTATMNLVLKVHKRISLPLATSAALTTAAYLKNKILNPKSGLSEQPEHPNF